YCSEVGSPLAALLREPRIVASVGRTSRITLAICDTQSFAASMSVISLRTAFRSPRTGRLCRLRVAGRPTTQFHPQQLLSRGAGSKSPASRNRVSRITSVLRALKPGLGGWKSECKPLIRNGRFYGRLEKIRREIKAEAWTLNQRVAGSSPAAPTMNSTGCRPEKSHE